MSNACKIIIGVGLMVHCAVCEAQSDPFDVPRYPYAVFYPERQPFGITDALALNNRNVFAGLLGPDAAAFGAYGAVIELESLGGEDSLAQGINDHNEIVGISTEAGGSLFDPRAVVWRNGVIEALPTLGGDDGMAYDINQKGQIVGWSDTEPGGLGPQQATLWDGETAIALESPVDPPWSAALGINDLGVAVGRSDTPEDGERAVMWDENGIHILPAFTIFSHGVAYDINNKGEIIGRDWYFSTSRPVMWINGEIVDGSILYRYFESASLWSINDHSVAVGVGAGERRLWGFMWKHGKGLHRLDNLIAPNNDAYIVAAHDINNHNQITGRCAVGGDLEDERAFFMTPVSPEMELSDPVPGVAGQMNMWTISGAQPNAEITFVYGLKGGGEFVPGCQMLDAVLQLNDATFMGRAIADSEGTATLSMHVPSAAVNLPIVMFQAFDPENCDESQLSVVTFE